MDRAVMGSQSSQGFGASKGMHQMRSDLYLPGSPHPSSIMEERQCGRGSYKIHERTKGPC